MNKVASIIAVIAGVILSGQCAIWGACLGGHDPKAGYPFPDAKGAVLFLVGVSVIPLLAVGVITLARRFLSSRHTSIRLPFPIALFFLAPLFSLAMGYSVQGRDNRTRDQEEKFYVRQKEAYSHYAAKVTADPGIVLRERWYEELSEVPWSADVSARRMVFEHSFRPDHLSVPYTGEQLREISERTGDKRILVVSHPNCPPDLIESMWTSVFATREAWIIGQMIHNPATPRHLLEAYRTERIKAGRPVTGWIDREIEERLQATEAAPASR